MGVKMALVETDTETQLDTEGLLEARGDAETQLDTEGLLETLRDTDTQREPLAEPESDKLPRS